MTTRQKWICFYTLFSKECGRFFRIWGQTLVPPVITSSLYFLIFGNFIGSRIEDINGFSLMQFMTPGLIMMSVVTSAYMNVSSSFYVGKFQRSIEELLVSPCSSHIIILGFTLAGVLRAFIIGCLILGTAAFFTEVKIIHPFTFFFFLFLTAFLFSIIGLINGIFAKKFDDISIVPTFVLTPLSYLGGIFYSVSQIPEAWAFITKLNPVFYLINSLRYALLGFSDVETWFSLFVLSGLVGALYVTSYVLLEKGVGIKS